MGKHSINHIKTHSVIICFLILNIVKVSIFNSIMIRDFRITSLIYKLLITALSMSIIYIILFLINKKRIWIFSYIVQIIYVVGGICYFDYFKAKFHLFQLATMFPEGAQVVKHLIIPIYPNMLIGIIDLPVFILFIFRYRNVNLKRFIKLEKRKIAIIISVLILISEMTNLIFNNSIIYLLKNYPKTENKVVMHYGSAVNSVCDFLLNTNGKGLLKQFDYGKTITKKKTKAVPSNVVMIQIESFDASLINKTYNGKYITPFLSNAANENIYHSKMMSYHLDGGTSDAEYSIINSVQPLTNFPSMKINAATYPNSLAKKFDKAGYNVNVFHGNIASFYNRKTAFKKMGFQNFYDIDKMGIKNVDWGASDGEVFNFTDKIINQQSKPFFSYIITMTSHTPFNYVDEFAKINDFDGIKDTSIKQYYKSVRYVDQQIEQFVNSVLKTNPNTYVFIYGDHTPEDLNSYAKSSGYLGKDYFEFVPLIIITPDKIKYSNNSYAVSFLDLAPTALDFSGVKYNIRSKGQSLVSCKKPSSLIYFKGKNYNREYLYNSFKIAATQAP